MEGITAGKAVRVAETLRKTIENVSIKCETGELKFTVSIGIIGVPPGEACSLNELLVSADSAMYRAKNSGRNRICLYEESGGK